MPNYQMRLDDAASRDPVPGKDISPGPSMPSQSEAAQGEASGSGLAASAPRMSLPQARAAHGTASQELANHTTDKAWSFTKFYVYVALADKLYNTDSGEFLKISAIERLYANDVGGFEIIKGALLEGAHAVEKVQAVTFKPGEGPFVMEGRFRFLNMWRPADVEPVDGDPARFLRHIEHIFDGDEAAISYVLDYMAHLVQKPGQKIPAAILLTGRQGTGKSLIAQIFRKMVGLHNSATLSPIDLMSQFNSFIERSIVTVVEEMTLDDRKGTAARLKAWITETETYINRKGIPQYKVPNQTHFFIVSNESVPLSIDADDRRFLVWASQATPKEPQYYTELTGWLEAEGYGCIMHFLMNRDLSGFNPHQAPPRTRARTELIRSCQSDLEAFLHEALEANEAPFNRDMVTADDVMRAALCAGLRVRKREVTTRLKDMGAAALGQKRVGDQKLRIWAIRNQSHWNVATEGEIAEAYRAGAGRGASQPVRRGALPPERLAVGATASGDAIPDAAGEPAAEAVAS